MRNIILGALGLGLVAAAPIGAANAAEPAAQPSLSQTYPGESYSQYKRYGPRYGHRYYRRGYGGGAAAAGVIGGLAAGAIIGGAIANSQAQAAPLPRTQDPDYI